MKSPRDRTRQELEPELSAGDLQRKLSILERIGVSEEKAGDWIYDPKRNNLFHRSIKIRARVISQRASKGLIIDENSELSNIQSFRDNVHLGKNVTIGHTVRLSEYVVVGDSSSFDGKNFIAQGTLVGRNAHIRKEVHIDSFSIIGDGETISSDYGSASLVGNDESILAVFQRLPHDERIRFVTGRNKIIATLKEKNACSGLPLDPDWNRVLTVDGFAPSLRAGSTDPMARIPAAEAFSESIVFPDPKTTLAKDFVPRFKTGSDK